MDMRLARRLTQKRNRLERVWFLADGGPRRPTVTTAIGLSPDRSARCQDAAACGGADGQAHNWSAAATAHSDALDLEPEVLRFKDAPRIALSLKRSAEHSRRRKSTPYRSAMSILTFSINRAGKNLLESRVKVLEDAKGELRKAFGRSSD
jgi:hypothetical protein